MDEIGECPTQENPRKRRSLTMMELLQMIHLITNQNIQKNHKIKEWITIRTIHQIILIKICTQIIVK